MMRAAAGMLLRANLQTEFIVVCFHNKIIQKSQPLGTFYSKSTK